MIEMAGLLTFVALTLVVLAILMPLMVALIAGRVRETNNLLREQNALLRNLQPSAAATAANGSAAAATTAPDLRAAPLTHNQKIFGLVMACVLVLVLAAMFAAPLLR